MKKVISYILLFVVLTSWTADNTKDKKAKLERDADLVKLIEQMTIEEKVGQMTQLNIDVVSVGEVFNLKEPHELDLKKLKNAIVDKHVGSILNVGGHAYDLEHWQKIVGEIQEMATEDSRLKIPVLYGIDAIHGANYLMGSTLFPQPLAQAATFNTSLVEECAVIAAYETRATGVPWNFSPVLDVARQPLWSRVFETYGEDVYLAKIMGAACVKGYQGDNAGDPERVSACMKHFLGYSMPWTGKDRTPVFIHERQLREYFLPTFQAAIDEGALSVMINSGELNGIPVHADKAILTDLLRTELGFEGVAVTDWEDIMKLQDNHKVAATLKDAVKMAVMAGIDLSMTPNNYGFTDLLIELVIEGEVPESRLDESVYRILKMKKNLDLFKNPFTPDNHTYDKVGSKEFSDKSYEMACESITLLKNENGTLPLSAGTKVFIGGPATNSMTMLNGAWSRTWQGMESEWDDASKQTILEGMQKNFTSITFNDAKIEDEAMDPAESILNASQSDVIILCLGELPSTEKPGDIDNLTINKKQIEYVKNFAKLGKPIICVLVENRPRIVSGIESFCDAVIMAYLPGDEGGRAVADILVGKINPSGRLPITYPRFVNSLLPYDHKYTDRLDQGFGWNAFNPQWEFGHGLSYSNLVYSDMEIISDTLMEDQNIEISVTVKNEGPYDAKESVLVYVADEVASITPSVKRLRAFKKEGIKVNESKTVSFSIPMEELKFVGIENKWILEEGTFVVQIENLKKTIYLKK
ncbi:MAG: beta-glucosidase [Glaciecola sp.]